MSHCASCDGPLFKGREVCVVGGGDAAFDEALVLSGHAARVTIFHRGETARAQQHLRTRAEETRNVAVESETLVEEIIGDEVVTAVRLRDANTRSTREQKIDGVFVAVGLDPATAFLQGVVALDASGHIETDILMRTSLAGVFAAGDIRKNSVAQLAAVAGDGATAAISAYRYLKERELNDHPSVGSSTILPWPSCSSTMRWASAARDSGSTRSIWGMTFPCAAASRQCGRSEGV